MKSQKVWWPGLFAAQLRWAGLESGLPQWGGPQSLPLPIVCLPTDSCVGCLAPAGMDESWCPPPPTSWPRGPPGPGSQGVDFPSGGLTHMRTPASFLLSSPRSLSLVGALCSEMTLAIWKAHKLLELGNVGLQCHAPCSLTHGPRGSYITSQFSHL